MSSQTTQDQMRARDVPDGCDGARESGRQSATAVRIVATECVYVGSGDEGCVEVAVGVERSGPRAGGRYYYCAVMLCAGGCCLGLGAASVLDFYRRLCRLFRGRRTGSNGQPPEDYRKVFRRRTGSNGRAPEDYRKEQRINFFDATNFFAI